MGGKARDVFLIVAILALVALAFWPSGEDEPRSAPPPAADDPADPVDDRDPVPPRVTPPAADAGTMKSGAAQPLLDVPHQLLPVVAGSRWVYQVSGPKHLAPEPTWTLVIDRPPTVDEPGKIRVGFGETLEERDLWLDDGALRLDGLPCVEPLEYIGNRPRKVSGVLLPARSAIIAGATWTVVYERKVTHAMRDDRGRVIERKATAVQRDRATMKEIHEVSVPAGRFDALRIEWSGRVEVKVGKRPVLDGLTLEPFRAETTWFAPGIGLVRRRVSYTGSVKDSVTFNLLRYERPEG
jgi:hypothetical protein